MALTMEQPLLALTLHSMDNSIDVGDLWTGKCLTLTVDVKKAKIHCIKPIQFFSIFSPISIH
jgi:hypothetical protein